MGNFFFKGPPRIDKPLFVQVGQKNDSYSNGSIPIKHRRLVGFYESSGGTSSFEATLGRTMFKSSQKHVNSGKNNNFLVQPLRPGGSSIPGDRKL